MGYPRFFHVLLAFVVAVFFTSIGHAQDENSPFSPRLPEWKDDPDCDTLREYIKDLDRMTEESGDHHMRECSVGDLADSLKFCFDLYDILQDLKRMSDEKGCLEEKEEAQAHSTIADHVLEPQGNVETAAVLPPNLPPQEALAPGHEPSIEDIQLIACATGTVKTGVEYGRILRTAAQMCLSQSAAGAIGGSAILGPRSGPAGLFPAFGSLWLTDCLAYMRGFCSHPECAGGRCQEGI